MLTVEHLTKQFGEKTLFRDLCLTVEGPAVLWAPSGWGKTTLAAHPHGAGRTHFRHRYRALAGWQQCFRRTGSARS